MSKVLICGATSFVAKGFAARLLKAGYEVDQFSRGASESRDGDLVKGQYIDIASNSSLSEHYDAVVNFAILKDASVQENIEYIQGLLQMCKDKGVKRLVHFSSIMEYNYHLERVDENTQIDTLENTQMKGYGEIKIATDWYLQKKRAEMPFEIVLVRPGYVLADERPSPFIMHLCGPLYMIKGNKNSKQPMVLRDDIQLALERILQIESNLPVYHFFPTDGMTKYRYAKKNVKGFVLTMPKIIFKTIPYILMKLKLIKPALYSRFDGMYIESDFQSQETQKKLNIKFR